MIAATFAPTISRRDTTWSKPAGATTSAFESVQGPNPVPPTISGGGSFGPQSAGAIYQHIHDMASKRISTLDYLRKALVYPISTWGVPLIDQR